MTPGKEAVFAAARQAQEARDGVVATPATPVAQPEVVGLGAAFLAVLRHGWLPLTLASLAFMLAGGAIGFSYDRSKSL